MPPELPSVGFFPALPLERNIQLGEWVVGKPPRGTPWVSEQFKRRSRTLIRSFKKRNFHDGAMLWHRDRGFDGSRPPDDVIDAIQVAVTFAVLDANDRLEGDLNIAFYLATTENAALHIQPIDVAEGQITHVIGGALKRFLEGGATIGKVPPPLADAVLPIRRPILASGKVASAIFDALRSGPTEKPHVRFASEWHRIAMANPNAITLQQRLIAIKTGFEALSGESKSWECSLLLRDLFEKTTATHKDLLPSTSMLWSPKEKTDLQRRYGKKNKQTGQREICDCSELQDWFMTLAAARNEVIHDGRLTIFNYPPPTERPLSRYAGKLFWKGERLLREAIKATLGPDILLCGLLARHAVRQAALNDLREAVRERQAVPAQEGDQPALPSAEEPPEESPPRNLSALLEALGCQTANVVQLKKLRGGQSATLEIAREQERRNRNKWAAKVGGRSILIGRAERDLLEAAGAEDELADRWLPCE